MRQPLQVSLLRRCCSDRIWIGLYVPKWPSRFLPEHRSHSGFSRRFGGSRESALRRTYAGRPGGSDGFESLPPVVAHPQTIRVGHPRGLLPRSTFARRRRDLLPSPALEVRTKSTARVHSLSRCCRNREFARGDAQERGQPTQTGVG